jgi:hypothetical protein
VSGKREGEPAGTVVDALAGVIPAGGDPAPASDYTLGAVTAQTAAVANTLGPKFGIRTVGGYRAGDPDPVGHTAGLALDFMTNDISRGQATGSQGIT